MFIEHPSVLGLTPEPATDEAGAHSMPHLIEARVIATQGSRMRLQTTSGEVWAKSALLYFYRPVPGDLVLALQQGETCYTVGVLHATGPISITAPGDFEIRAPRGKVALTGRYGVHLAGDELTLTGNRLSVVVGSLVERLTNACRRVKGACQTRAARMRVVVDDDYRLRAGRIDQHAEADVRIDGRSIHLG